MEEILKKIYEMKVKAHRLIVEPPHDSPDEIANDISEGYITACNEIRDYILSEKKEPLTIGDKIRESNESLAEFIKKYDAQYIDDCYCRHLCEHRVDSHCDIAECDRSNYNGILEYLNQPINQSSGKSGIADKEKNIWMN